MIAFFHKLANHPLVNPIITGILVLVLAEAGAVQYLHKLFLNLSTGWFPESSGGTSFTWLWYPILGLALYMVLLVVRTLLINWITNEDDPYFPQFYRKDLFAGVIWRWRYALPQGELQRLAPHCPECDRQISPQTKTQWLRGGKVTTFSCFGCDFSTSEELSFEEIATQVVHEVQNNIRGYGYVHSLHFKRKKLRAAAIPAAPSGDKD